MQFELVQGCAMSKHPLLVMVILDHAIELFRYRDCLTPSTHSETEVIKVKGIGPF